jgi:hypothetical protein
MTNLIPPSILRSLQSTTNSKEKRIYLDTLAEELLSNGFKGNIVKQISRKYGFQSRWILNYISEKYKDTSKTKTTHSDTSPEELIRIDILNFLSRTIPERRTAGCSWRDIQTRHKIGSSKLNRIRCELLGLPKMKEFSRHMPNHIEQMVRNKLKFKLTSISIRIGADGINETNELLEVKSGKNSIGSKIIDTLAGQLLRIGSTKGLIVGRRFSKSALLARNEHQKRGINIELLTLNELNLG